MCQHQHHKKDLRFAARVQTAHGRSVRSEFGKSSIRGDDVVEQVADGVYLKVDGQWVPPSAVRIQLGALCDAFHHIVLMD